MRRLAGHGFLEYHLARQRDGAAEVVIEPQMPDYWPRLLALDDDEVLVLSRFAYLRRRADDLVLDSPRAGGLFRICDPEIAAAIARLVSPQPSKAPAQRSERRRRSASRPAHRLPHPVSHRSRAYERSALSGGKRRPCPVGLSRSPVSHALDRRPACQSGWRGLSLCRRDVSVAGGAARLARAEDRPRARFPR